MRPGIVREFLDRVAGQPHRTVVKLGALLEPERGVAGAEFRRDLHEEHDAVCAFPGGHAVPRTRVELGCFLDDHPVDCGGEVAVFRRHGVDKFL